LINGVDTTVRRVQVMNHSSDVAAIGDHKIYYFPSNKLMALCPITAACEIYVELAISPLSSVTEVDDFLWDTWRETIIAGAKARLYRMPGNPWTNLGLVQICERDFLRGAVAARRQQKKGGSSTPLTITPRSDQVWI